MKWIIKYSIISILLLCSIFIFLLGGTSEGLLLSLHYVSQYLPGSLQIEKASGALLSDFTLENIKYEYQGNIITLPYVSVSWYPASLIEGKIAFGNISLKNPSIILSEIGSTATTTESTDMKTILAWLSRLSFQQLHIDHLQLKKDNQTIYFQGDLSDHWNATWGIDLPNLHDFFSDVNGSLTSQGVITGTRLEPSIQAKINGKKINYDSQKIDSLNAIINVNLRPETDSSIKLTVENIQLSDYHFKSLSLEAKGRVKKDKNDLYAIISMNTDKSFNANAKLQFPKFKDFKNPKQSVVGNIRFDLRDLSLLDTLIPDIKNSKGTLTGNVTIQGTLKEPQMVTQLQLSRGSFSLPIVGLNPSNINATGMIDNQLNITFTGSADSGKGRAQLSGSCDLTKPDYPLTLAVQANNIDIVNLPEYKAKATTSNFKLLFAYPTLKLEGKILIPSADIKPKKLGGSVSMPEEVVFVDQTAKQEEVSAIILSADLQLQLGDQVNIDYDNLQATLLGSLSITKLPDSPAQGSGELYTLNGKYTAYGQKLTILTGRLIYTGNLLNNPGLNIRAGKQVRRVVTQNVSSFGNPNMQTLPSDELFTVGVQVAGTANSPRINLFSNPSDLSQADILSYLLLGVPQSQASGAQGSMLLTALTAYNPNAGNISGITDKLQKTLGFNELNVESVETFNPTTQSVESTTSFVVGKQITQKLSIHYSIGLFNPVSILNLRYQMTKHWAIQTETSSLDSGADLLYGFERD